jgi:phosphoribosyl 1,2-cyclic phosphodiesterase
VGTESTKILIDAGLSAKATAARLEALGVSLQEIQAIFITHEHIDHIRGLDVITKNYNIPVFANSETAQALCAVMQRRPQFKIFATNEPFAVGDIEVRPFSVSHDAIDPVAFSLTTQGVKLGICADLGIATTLVISELKGSDYLYLEANHEPSMVHACNRPPVYKERVLGRQGHLSNQQCAALLKEVYHAGLRHIHLAHLSSECNAPDLALKTIQDTLAGLGGATEVSIAQQETISRPIPFPAKVPII